MQKLYIRDTEFKVYKNKGVRTVVLDELKLFVTLKDIEFIQKYIEDNWTKIKEAIDAHRKAR